MNKNRNIGDVQELVAIYLSGDASLKEKELLETWIKESEANSREYEQFKNVFENAGFYYKSKDFKVKPAWEKVHELILKDSAQNKSRTIGLRMLLKYAAIFVFIALFAGLGYYYIQNKIPPNYEIAETVNKEIINELTLPDGTVVSLNSNTKLTYPKQFSRDIREVKITGEAFFDVKPDAKKPFVINAGKARIKVLGTSFNVSAYPESETVEVIVRSGKVQVSKLKNNSTEKVLLTAGDKGILFNSSRELKKMVNTDPNYYSWKTQELIFNESKLTEVISTLEKTYHVKISLSEDELNDLLYTAHFTTQPIEYILEVITLTFNMDLSYQNEQFYLDKRIDN